MLSKCFNPRCDATFHYFGQGRLFCIDFAAVARKRVLAGKKPVDSDRSDESSLEHFWLCERCAATMTIELSDSGEVCLVPLEFHRPATASPTQTETAHGARHFLAKSKASL